MKQSTPIGRLLLVSMWVLLSLIARSQNPTYEMYITNQSQVSSKEYQFDVYLLNTGGTQLRLASVQFGIGIDTMVINGGTLSFSYVPGSSQLRTLQTPQSVSLGGTSFLKTDTVNGVEVVRAYRYMNQAARSGPGVDSATLISAVKSGCSSPGTRIGTYKLTNTVDFRNSSTFKHIFSVSAASGRTNTVVTAYVSGVNTTLTGTPMGYTVSGTCDQNVSLNPCNVSGSYSMVRSCPDMSNGSAKITLSGMGSSSMGVYYLDGDSVGVSYSTNPFTIGGLSSGTHSLKVSSGTGPCLLDMSLNVEVLASEFSAESCDSYVWDGRTYTASGDYSYAYQTTRGCDSVATLHLTINNSQASSFSAESCDSYVWDGRTYTASGSYNYVYQTVKGCDSVATLELTINPSKTKTVTATSCDSYVWDGRTYTASGSYNYAYQTTKGCDSVVTLQLTINPSKTKTVTATSCDRYVWDGRTYTASGNYPYTYQTTKGCDSVVTLQLTINVTPVTEITTAGGATELNCVTTSIAATASGADSYVWNRGASSLGSNAALSITSAGTYVVTGTRTGCSSKDTVVITLSSNLPAAPMVASVPVSCTGSSKPTLSATAVTGTTIFWYSQAEGGTALNVAGSATYPLPAAITSTTTYYAEARNISGGCASDTRTAVVVVVGTTPSAPVGTGSSACGTSSLTLTATPSGNDLVVDWYSVPSLGSVLKSSSTTLDTTSTTTGVTKTFFALSRNTINGCVSSTRTAVLGTWKAQAAAPATLVVAPVTTNVCTGKVYRYTAPAVIPTAPVTLAQGTGYLWSFTGSLGATASYVNGTSATSAIIDVSFSSNAAAGTEDSVKLVYTSACGYSPAKALKLTNVATTLPLAPASIVATPVLTNVCTGKKYRYTAPALPAATLATTTSASVTGRIWSFVGSLGTSAQITTGSDSSMVIEATYNSNAAAGTEDSVKLIYTSACGYSPAKALKLTNVVTTLPVAPASIVAAPVLTNVCTGKKYRYTAPALPAATAATTTAAAVTGRIWSFVGTLGSIAQITTGDVNSTVIEATYNSNAAAGTGDSVKLIYTTACGYSPAKALKLTNVATTLPVAPASIVAAPVLTNVCTGKKYRYTAPALPAATAVTTTAAAVTGRIWSFVGTLGSAAQITTGDSSSTVIEATYSSNATANTGDSVKLIYTSACGYSPAKALKLTNVASTIPVPASIVAAVVTDACGARRYRYTAPTLATTLTAPSAVGAVQAVNGYQWVLPTGAVGSTGTLAPGFTLTSNPIEVIYTSNAAAPVSGDSVKVSYTTASCGNGATKGLKLTNIAKAGCPSALPVTRTTQTVTPSESMSVKVYPNPTTSNFNMQVISAGKEKIGVRVMDVQGRVLKTLNVQANETLNIGSELNPGSYMIEVKQGKQTKTTRVLKF